MLRDECVCCVTFRAHSLLCVCVGVGFFSAPVEGKLIPWLTLKESCPALKAITGAISEDPSNIYALAQEECGGKRQNLK